MKRENDFDIKKKSLLCLENCSSRIFIISDSFFVLLIRKVQPSNFEIKFRVANLINFDYSSCVNKDYDFEVVTRVLSRKCNQKVQQSSCSRKTICDS